MPPLLFVSVWTDSTNDEMVVCVPTSKYCIKVSVGGFVCCNKKNDWSYILRDRQHQDLIIMRATISTWVQFHFYVQNGRLQ